MAEDTVQAIREKEAAQEITAKFKIPAVYCCISTHNVFLSFPPIVDTSLRAHSAAQISLVLMYVSVSVAPHLNVVEYVPHIS